MTGEVFEQGRKSAHDPDAVRGSPERTLMEAIVVDPSWIIERSAGAGWAQGL